MGGQVLGFPSMLLISSAPLIYLKFLRALYLHARRRVSPAFADGLGHLIKFIGASLFTVGHGMQCMHKQSAEITDWGYILACTPCLNLAFGGAFLGRPMPLSLLASGLLLHVAYLPLLLRAFLSGAPKLLPGIGVVAASLLTWLGSVATLLDRSILTASPLLPLPVYAMLTSCSFGLGNSLKLQKLLEAQEPVHQAFVGQVLKVLASTLLITGNSLGLGWHNVRVRRYCWGLSVLMAASLRALAATWKPRKPRKPSEVLRVLKAERCQS